MKQLISDKNINKLFGGDFELITHKNKPGQFNMDFDFERTMLCSKGEVLPILRFYGWNPWTVSLGYNQKENEIDNNLIDKKGFGLVRRPTGGRAVLHADELTYSVVLNLHNNLTPQDIYREIHFIILNGIKKLGASNTDFEKSQTDFREFYKKEQGMSLSCFASTARYEIDMPCSFL